MLDEGTCLKQTVVGLAGGGLVLSYRRSKSQRRGVHVHLGSLIRLLCIMSRSYKLPEYKGLFLVVVSQSLGLGLLLTEQHQ